MKELSKKQKAFLQLLEKINDKKHSMNQELFSVKSDYYEGTLSTILEAVEKLEVN